MANDLELERVEGVRVEEYPGGFRLIRRGWIRNIDLTQDPEEIFANAVLSSGMPAIGTAFPKTEYAEATLARRIVEGRPLQKTKADVTLVYDTRNFGPPDATFILTRSSTLVERATEIHPANGHPITVSWTNPNDSGDVRPDDTVTMRYMAPFKRIIATAFMSGEPSSGIRDALGYVNNATWQGAAAGYWLCAGVEDTTSDRGRNYTFRAEFWSKVVEDWRNTAVMRDQHGHILYVDPADADTLRAEPYDYTVSKLNGIVWAGLYPLLDFGTTFGF